jgi:hypothetical protein
MELAREHIACARDDDIDAIGFFQAPCASSRIQ